MVLPNTSAAVATVPESLASVRDGIVDCETTRPSWALPSEVCDEVPVFSGDSWALPGTLVGHSQPLEPEGWSAEAAAPPAVISAPEPELIEDEVPLSPLSRGDRGPDGKLYTESKKQMDLQVQVLIDDYLGERSLQEAMHDTRKVLEEHPDLEHHLVKRLLGKSLDKSERDREMFAKLITSLCIRGDISSEGLRRGFLALLEVMGELALDVPDISLHVGYFLAIVLMDHCLTDDVLDDVIAVTGGSNLAHEAVACARSFVSGILPLGVEQVKSNMSNILHEFMANADIEEAVEYVHDLNAPHFHHEVVKRTITLAMNMHKRECELSSQLLKGLYKATVISVDQIEDGVVRLLFRLHDLVLDTPSAPQLLACFVQRLIGDGLLPRDFALMNVPAELILEGTLGGEFVNKLEFLLAAEESGVANTAPEQVWGAAAASIDGLKVKMDAILHEYFAAGDVEECLAAVATLESPHFVHEMVRRSIMLSMDLAGRGHELVVALLRQGCETGQLSAVQVVNGLDKVLERIPELSIDVPRAPQLYAQLLYTVFEEAWVPSDYLASFLNRKGQSGKVHPMEQAVFKELENILMQKRGISM